MIVASLFDGDGCIDSHVMWKQHDVYYDALDIISRTCQEYAQFANRMARDVSELWEHVEKFDHRTLQLAHDILAAAWRFEHEIEVRQMKLPGCGPCEGYFCQSETYVGMWTPISCPQRQCAWLRFKEEPDVAVHWLSWLREEVRSWKHRPAMICCVMEILANQNTPLGYQVERALCWNLILHYGEVPWMRPFYAALRQVTSPTSQAAALIPARCFSSQAFLRATLVAQHDAALRNVTEQYDKAEQ